VCSGLSNKPCLPSMVATNLELAAIYDASH